MNPSDVSGSKLAHTPLGTEIFFPSMRKGMLEIAIRALMADVPPEGRANCTLKYQRTEYLEVDFPFYYSHRDFERGQGPHFKITVGLATCVNKESFPRSALREISGGKLTDHSSLAMLFRLCMRRNAQHECESPLTNYFP